MSVNGIDRNLEVSSMFEYQTSQSEGTYLLLRQSAKFPDRKYTQVVPNICQALWRVWRQYPQATSRRV
jgi:hypothetical protein